MTSDQSILTSGLLSAAGVVHGFTTRQGGVSEGAFRSFNLSLKVGDVQERVMSNRRRWKKLTGLDFGKVVELNQVHEAHTLVLGRDQDLPPAGRRSYDASATSREDLVLAVSTADCVPVLLFSKSPPAVAAVHAGWKGTLANVIDDSVRAMCGAFGCVPGEMIASIGPCIHANAFEVGLDVAERFRKVFGERVTGDFYGKARVDLVAANRLCLLGAGLKEESIDVLDHCTFTEEDLFFSHRRDKGKTGRHLSYITLGS